MGKTDVSTEKHPFSENCAFQRHRQSILLTYPQQGRPRLGIRMTDQKHCEERGGIIPDDITFKNTDNIKKLTIKIGYQ